MANNGLVVFFASIVGIVLVQSITSALPPIPGYEQILIKSLLGGARAEEEGSRLPDPLLIDPFVFDFSTIPTNEGLTLSGKLSVCNNATITGLSEIDEPYLNTKPENHSYVDVVFGIYTETIYFVGSHDLFLNVTKGENISIVEGSGPFDVELVGAKFITELVVLVDPRTNLFNITNLALHLGFDCIAINMPGVTVDGVELNWAELSSNLKIAFDNFWNESKEGLARLLQLLANALLSECTIDELLVNVTECIMEGMNPEMIPENTLLDYFLEFINTGDAETMLQGILLEILDSDVAVDEVCQANPLSAPSSFPPRATCDHLNNPDPISSTEAPSASPNTLKCGITVSLVAILAYAFL